MDNFGRDRFELLSAYLDGEVTAQERQQVQQWLENDRQMQQLHSRLLRLRHGMQHLPVPESQQSPAQLSSRVFQKLDRRQSRRRGLLAVGGIAAVIVGAISSLTEESLFQMADSLFIDKDNPRELAIALNRPAVDIPQAVVPASRSPQLGRPIRN